MSTWLVSLGYLGAFIGPLIGVFAFFLFPWPVLIFSLGYLLNPLVVALLGATGATLGTTLYYLVGEGICKILPSKVKTYLSRGQKYLEKYGALAIFFFAVTPLPDEIMWIPVGCMKYNVRKAIIACWLGKFILMAAISFTGYYGFQQFLGF
ncbi:MAG: VTT domain-containing protein [Candidatus Bathyarchaeota archaeon]